MNRTLRHTLGALSLLFAGICTADAQQVEVHIKNSLNLCRRDVAEIPMKEIYQKLGVSEGTDLVVRNADKDEVPSQRTHDGWLLVQSMAHPFENETFTIEVGTPKTYRNDVSGRIYPKRADDLAWENDRNAWRVYGPALRKDNPHGIDCFTKNQPAPSLDGLYQDALERGISYHENHGLGMDAYTVGPTLGCGAPVLLQNGMFNYSVVYDEVEILENGPLRFEAKLIYRHEGGIVETRELRQDRGSHLVRCIVRYQGVKGKATVLSGISIHKDNPEEYLIDKKRGFIAYADHISSPKTRNGELFVACLYPQKMKTMKYLPLEKEVASAVGHLVGGKDYEEGDNFLYWFGSAWSQYDVPSMNVWAALLNDYREMLSNPLEVEVGTGK